MMEEPPQDIDECIRGVADKELDHVVLVRKKDRKNAILVNYDEYLDLLNEMTRLTKIVNSISIRE
jgi:hypothetical protein